MNARETLKLIAIARTKERVRRALANMEAGERAETADTDQCNCLLCTLRRDGPAAFSEMLKRAEESDEAPPAHMAH